MAPGLKGPEQLEEFRTRFSEREGGALPDRPNDAPRAYRLDTLTSKRYSADMSTPKRATIYIDANLHKALRLKAAQTDQSLSELVNTAVRQSLLEDAEDLAAFESRVKEPNLDFETFVKDLRRRGKL